MAPGYRIRDYSEDAGMGTFGGFSGPKLNWSELATRKPTTFFPPLAQQPTTFSPPLALQQSVWDSIVHGNFIDAKIFAFSRRTREPGRVDTPKALFVNTHVLATACGYFQSGTPLYFFKGLMLIIPTAFDFSDGIATNLEAGFPPGVEPFFQMEEPDDDYDDPVEVPAEIQPPIDAAAPVSLGKAVKAYIVNYTAHRTFVDDS